MNFEYTDTHADTLKLKDCPHLAAVSVRVLSDGGLVSVLVPYTEVRGLAEALLESSGEESYIIPKTDSLVTETAGLGWFSCGVDKSLISAPQTSDPKILLERAAHLVTIAQEILGLRAKDAAEQALETRRDKVTQELTGNAKARYEHATDLAKKAIDLIIKLQDEKEEKND